MYMYLENRDVLSYRRMVKDLSHPVLMDFPTLTDKIGQAKATCGFLRAQIMVTSLFSYAMDGMITLSHGYT